MKSKPKAKPEPKPFHPGPLVRQARESRGWTQEQLAHAIGSDRTRVSKVEHGDEDPSPDWLARAAAALAVDPGKFGVLSPDERVQRNLRTEPGVAPRHTSAPNVAPRHTSGPASAWPAALHLTIDRAGGRDDPNRLVPVDEVDRALLTELGHPHRLDLADLGTLPVLLSNRGIGLAVDYGPGPVEQSKKAR